MPQGCLRRLRSYGDWDCADGSGAADALAESADGVDEAQRIEANALSLAMT